MEPDTAWPPRGSWRTWLTALALWLALALVAAGTLWHLHRETLDSQSRELGLLSLALTDSIESGLRGAQEGLQALQQELRTGRLATSGADAVRALRIRADLMPLVDALWLVDEGGRLIVASDDTPLPELGSFAPPLASLAGDATALSRPIAQAARAQMGVETRMEVRVALAVRCDLATGARGWIVAAMPAAALLGAFRVALPAADARMVVLRADGVRLAAINVGPPASDEASVARSLATRPSLEIRTLSDGSVRLVGLQRVPRYGVMVILSRDLGSILTAWRQAAEVAALALALLLVVMSAAVHLVLRADRRRSEAQQALQAQRSRASKLESLGTLAGGVAHDFNNVLAGIVGFGEMAQDAAVPGSAQARHLDKVLNAALRGKSLVERILAFSRGGARAATPFELEPIVEEVLTLLSASLRPGLVLERALEAPSARVRGDPTQAFEAVMNLCANAMQAMPGGGMLSVHLRREHVAVARVLSHSALPVGDYVALVVADQGAGITKEVMEHLFEPFFTTRAAQSGTGLGLAVVHGVVSEFGGAIDVGSRPGQGATFTLYFPQCADESETARAPAVIRPGAGQRLLVIDDEPDLVGLALEMLQGLGYEPEGYIDATVALQALRLRPHDYAAVITDELMPGLSGTRLTESLRRFAPHLPVLLVSGYGGVQLAQRAAAAGVTRLLAKPLQRAELARVLAALLR